jgi:hypothetical protein
MSPISVEALEMLGDDLRAELGEEHAVSIEAI